MSKIELMNNIAFIERVIGSCQTPETHDTVNQWLDQLVRSRQIDSVTYENLKSHNEYLQRDKANKSRLEETR